MKKKQKKIRVLSGIRASQDGLHLGNLLGAVEGMVELQNDPRYETFYMVADLHGITTPYKTDDLRKNRLEIAKDFLAAGIDPNKSVLFCQSDVPEHAELAFYLSSVITFARLTHLPSYKDKIKLYPDHNTAALFNYPVLMAADILLYKAKEVPLGADQIYHLEVTREIAKKMNAEYNTDFPEPTRYVARGKETVIPDLLSSDKDANKKKMSKSSPNGAIFLNDSLDVITNKISKIPTSTTSSGSFPDNGGVYTIYQLTKIFVNEKRANQYKNDYLAGTVRYGDVKKELSVAIYNKIRKIQEKRAKLDKDPDRVKKILEDGARKARLVATQTMEEVREKMGLS